MMALSLVVDDHELMMIMITMDNDKHDRNHVDDYDGGVDDNDSDDGRNDDDDDDSDDGGGVDDSEVNDDDDEEWIHMNENESIHIKKDLK